MTFALKRSCILKAPINLFSLLTTRMPLILSDDLEDDRLNPNHNESDVQSLIKIYPEDQLVYHTVNRLRGKEYLGNIEKISNEVLYEELEF